MFEICCLLITLSHTRILGSLTPGTLSRSYLGKELHLKKWQRHVK